MDSANCDSVSLEIAAERLMSLGPFAVKNLLYRVLSGKEEDVFADMLDDEHSKLCVLHSFPKLNMCVVLKRAALGFQLAPTLVHRSSAQTLRRQPSARGQCLL